MNASDFLCSPRPLSEDLKSEREIAAAVDAAMSLLTTAGVAMTDHLGKSVRSGDPSRNKIEDAWNALYDVRETLLGNRA